MYQDKFCSNIIHLKYKPHRNYFLNYDENMQKRTYINKAVINLKEYKLQKTKVN